MQEFRNKLITVNIVIIFIAVFFKLPLISEYMFNVQMYEIQRINKVPCSRHRRALVEREQED
ncbi:MAG: hypothetical protein COA57_08325 [Flavobacteriales bacterium]|nr:MAG: hypothetical protein COA57_08325 [Flavobacteriales bacterium]